MQGREDAQRGYLDVEALAGELLAPGSVFAFLAKNRGRLFPDSVMEDLFPSRRGRPSVPAPVIGSVLVLQALQGLSDRETAEALTYDLRWKAACGYGLTDTAFHPSTLTYWRRRLAASGNPHRIMEAIAEVITETGVLVGKRRRAVDSTVLDDAVARQDTITQLIAAVRRFGRDIPGGKHLVATHAAGYDYTRTGKPDIAWDDQDAKDGLITALVTDALALLAAVDPESLEGRAAEAYALLALVAGQDVEPADDSDGTDGRWRIARKVAPDRMISTVDPDTRHAHKTQARQQDGFKAHIVIEPDTGLITAAELTKASGPENSDGSVGARLVTNDHTITGSIQVLADSAYGSGEMLAALTLSGHAPIIKPWPLRPAVEGGFSLDDFTVDEAAGTATCPNGLTRPISTKRRVTFGAACAGCPLRTRCTTSPRGRKLVLHEHDALQREHRQRAKDQDFQDQYRAHRPMVERSIAWLTRGNRRVRHRGISRNNAWLQLRIAGLNLRRLLNLGLTTNEGSWAIG
ncbi:MULTISPECIES: IS1182 family transposase [Paenarthrobacter]|uniref:IS1182 family transposase n=1 Tax=Paenarthrobacter TaxID=1742992 RepID=UPI00074D313B|nr:IS1182 family transposase [Paenarthrobacter ureafaciens]AMB41148.1 transposase [Arthrobacter sp. ATCC 21022]KUR65961.1 transposase [Arthrobacter sp. ATCC 21022]RWW99804.1 IS1182 family transposase [Paenarthrobacter ureafaciens]